MPLKEDSLTPKLYHFLATAIEILSGDKGNIQFYDEIEQTLRIVAHIGFSDEFLRTFQFVNRGHACCGVALERCERVIVEDTAKDSAFDKVGSTSNRFGFAAVISTPLFDEDGKLFGMLSVHFRKTHRPSDNELILLDEYLKRAAPTIARKRQQAELDGDQMPTAII